MCRLFKFSFLTLIFIFIYNAQSLAQVTIGASIEPIEGALLDLKETNVTNGANATRGLLYPRVFLTDVGSLTDIANGTLTASDDPSKHTGLTVYNVNPDFAGKKGLNIWDGTKWTNIIPDTIVKIERDTITINIEKAYFTGLANDATSVLSASIGSSNWKTTAFKSILIDSKLAYNATSGIFTVQTTGAYDIFARYIYSGATILSTVGVAVYKKAPGESTFAQISEDKLNIAIGLTGGVRSISPTNVPLNAGDQLMFGVQTGGVTISIAGGTSLMGMIKQH